MTTAADSNPLGAPGARYIAVLWRHSLPEEPVELFSELDDARWERRKIEVYRDGHSGYADGTESSGSTGLGVVPIPSLEEIAADPQFTPREITRDEFEALWRNRKNNDRET